MTEKIADNNNKQDKINEVYAKLMEIIGIPENLAGENFAGTYKQCLEIIRDSGLSSEDTAGLFSLIKENQTSRQEEKPSEENIENSAKQVETMAKEAFTAQNSGNNPETDGLIRASNELCKARESFYVAQPPMLLPAQPERKISEDAKRPQTASMESGTPGKRNFWNRIRDNLEQVRMDIQYRMVPEKAKDVQLPGLDVTRPDKSFRLKKLNYNRYPKMTTAFTDFTKIETVVLPDPQQNPQLNLRGSKLKGNLNLGAYDSVDLSHADLSNVKELDLRGCKKINLSGLDLRNVKVKLPPQGAEYIMEDTRLPRCDTLDLSNRRNILQGVDLSRVDKAVLPEQDISAGQITGWPRHLDASRCNRFEAENADMKNLVSLKPPAARSGNTAAALVLRNCKFPDMAELDVTACGKTEISGNDMPSLHTLKIRGVFSPYKANAEEMRGNRAPGLKGVEVSRTWTPSEDKNKMFETYRNIAQAAAMNHNVYKDAETGKMCHLDENQKKALEIINNSFGLYGKNDNNNLKSFWNTMSGNCNNLEQLRYGDVYRALKTPEQKQVMTEYNKALSQALGLKNYVNMQTLKYEQTPPLKAGETVDIPHFNLSALSKMKSADMDKWGHPHHSAANGSMPARQAGKER